MLNIIKIEGYNGRNNLLLFLSRQRFLPFFFFSPFTLNTYLTHNGKNLHIVNHEGQEALVMSREKPKEIRFFFNKPSVSMEEAVFEYFKPVYVSINETDVIDKEFAVVNMPEVEIFLDPIANLSDKNIRKKYNQCKRNHPNLRFENYKPEKIEKVKKFIQKWNAYHLDKSDKFIDTKNDLYFFELYNDHPDVLGGIIIDDDEIVSISFSVPSMDGNLISVINKCLRGYTELGVFNYVERSRFLCDKGFNRIYIGSVSNDFKKKFLQNAFSHDVYSHEIYKAPNFKSSEWHLLNLFN